MYKKTISSKKPFQLNLNEVLAVIALTFSFMGAYPAFFGTVGTLRWVIFYYGRFVLMFVFVFYTLMKHMNIIYKGIRHQMLVLNVLPILAMLIYSCFVWIFNSTSLPYVTRGLSNSFYALLACVSGVALVSIFKERTFGLGAISLLLTFFCSFFMGFAQYGSAFLNSLFAGNSTGPLYELNNEFIELHEVIFSAGLYILCFLFFRSARKNKLLLFLCTVCFFLGFKRIGIAALLVAILFFVVVSKMNDRAQKRTVQISGYISIVLALGWVALSVSDELSTLLLSHGISMSGRNIIYDYFRKFCTFSPAFIGRGVGFVSKQFEYVTAADLYNMVAIRALHNDLMRMFIEIGFVGFIVWVWYWMSYAPMYLWKRTSSRAALLCFILLLYAFITYTTDNTQGYFNFQLQLAMLLTGIVYMDQSEVKQRQVRLNKEGYVI